MTDLVGTCPMDFWEEWIAEGDPADTPFTGAMWSGKLWSWYTRSPSAKLARPGDRFYVVAYGKLRGYAPILFVTDNSAGGYQIVRGGHAQGVTIDAPISGFRGLRLRWWPYDSEQLFPTWRAP